MRLTSSINNRVYDDFVVLCASLGLALDREIEQAMVDHLEFLSLYWAYSSEGREALGSILAPETLAILGGCS